MRMPSKEEELSYALKHNFNPKRPGGGGGIHQ